MPLTQEQRIRLMRVKDFIVSHHFSESDWYNIGVLTNSYTEVDNHPRLLRSLSWGDGDYEGCVVQVLVKMVEKSEGNLDGIITYLKEKFPDDQDQLEDGMGTGSNIVLQNPKAGDRLSVVYQVERHVGQGGNGHVFVVTDGCHRFAAKVLDCKLREDEEKIKRFKYEIDGLKGVDHPNVVSIWGSGETVAGMPFYIMPLAKMSLRDFMRSDASLDQRERIARELLAGVKALHDHGIIHRDIKPENVLIIDDHAVVADIGIAHFNDIDTVLTQKGERLANFSYAAPEQRRKNPIPARTMDIYSCAVVIHELFTGEFLQGIGGTPISSISAEMGSWDKAIESAMNNDPANRPQTIDEFLAVVDEKHEWICEPRNPRSWCTHFSYDRVAEAFPDTAKNPVFTKWESFEERLHRLFRRPILGDLMWWTHGLSNMSITNVAIDDMNQLVYFDSFECKIRKVVPFRFPNLDWLDFVYFETDGMPPANEQERAYLESRLKEVSIGDTEILGRVCRYNGTLLTGEEVDNGCFYDAGGHYCKIDRAKLQDVSRLLAPWNFIVTSKWSPLNSQTIGAKLEELLDSILLQDVDPSILRTLAEAQKKPNFDRLDAWWAEVSATQN